MLEQEQGYSCHFPPRWVVRAIQSTGIPTGQLPRCGLSLHPKKEIGSPVSLPFLRYNLLESRWKDLQARLMKWNWLYHNSKACPSCIAPLQITSWTNWMLILDGSPINIQYSIPYCKVSRKTAVFFRFQDMDTEHYHCLHVFGRKLVLIRIINKNTDSWRQRMITHAQSHTLQL